MDPDNLFYFSFPPTVHQRPLPQPTMPSMSSNTFPSRSTKPSPKHALPSPHMPGAFSERSVVTLSFSVNLTSHQGPLIRTHVGWFGEERNEPVVARSEHFGSSETKPGWAQTTTRVSMLLLLESLCVGLEGYRIDCPMVPLE